MGGGGRATSGGVRLAPGAGAAGALLACFALSSRRVATPEFGRPSNGGRVGVLPFEKDAEGAESDGEDRAEHHQGKSVHQRDRDIEDDVLEAGASVVGEVLVSQRYRHEQNQRCLHHRGEQPPVADQQNRGDAADDVQECERAGQFVAARSVDQNSEKCEPRSDGHSTPRGYAGQSREDGSVIQRYPRAGTLGGRHPSRLAVVQPTASSTRPNPGR